MYIKTILFWTISILIIAFLIGGCTPAKNTPLPAITASPTITPTLKISATPAPSATGVPGLPTGPAPAAEEPETGPATATPAAPAVQATPTLTASSEPAALTPTPAGAVTCTNTAGFFGDVTIPDDTSLQQNVQFTKTWAIRNEGTCRWGPDYSLIFYGGAQMSGPLSVPLPAADPGEIIQISLNLKSPSSGGTFTGLWVFQDPAGERFGVNSGGIDQIWVRIGVTIFNDEGEIVPVGATPLPSPTPSVGDTIQAQNTCTPQQNSDYEQQLLKMINNARAQNKLSPLALNSRLSAAAFTHSADMACKDYVDHAGSDGSTWFTRIKAQSYAYSYASENIYVGNPAFGGTPSGAFDWWMNSQVHRDNILSTKVSEIGIGYAFYPNSSYGGYYTLDFARP
jgi:uncharacterized protein YkwD